MTKQSFLSNLIGNNNYEFCKQNSKMVAIIGTAFLTFFLGLSLICHYEFVNHGLGLITGFSLLSIIYVADLIILFDKRVDIDTDVQKKHKYKKTAVRGCILIVLGVGMLVLGHIYKRNYSFDCTTFYVDDKHEVYHIFNGVDCEAAYEVDVLIKKKGYQINNSYKLCPNCKEWAEELENGYEPKRSIH